jgi:hypothetical protein
MALGFQDCCNGLNFFLINSVPATVSEFEVYNIQTQEGAVFCAIYVNLPALNYAPPTYNAISLTQQTDCETCLTSNPCPTTETIFHSQFGEGSVVTTSDCNVTTIRQMQVQCFPTSPTYENSLDGSLDLFINNGTPPYIIRDYITGQVINASKVDDFYGVKRNISAGTYNFFVTDFTSDFGIPISCLVTAPPPLPVFGCNTQDNTFYDKPDGILDFIVLSAGTPPYRYYFGNSQFQIPIPTLIRQGTYNIRYEDQYYVQYIQCTVGGPPEVIWPDNLCMTFDYCSTSFRLSFTKQTNPRKIDYRAWYLCDNPEQVGCERLVLRFEDALPGGWFIESQPIIFPISLSVPNACALVNFTFSAAKNVNPRSDQPDGDWKIFGDLNANATLTSGPCGLSLQLIAKEDFTPVTNEQSGKALLQSVGGISPVSYLLTGENDFIYQTNTPVVENLKPGNYKAKAIDANGSNSNEVSFVINTVDPVDFISNFNPCVITNYTNEWVTQLPGGSSTRIEDGESLLSTINSTSTFNFNFLPDNSIMKGRIKITLDAYVVVGPSGFTNPDVVASIDLNSISLQSVTDGIPFNFMEGVCSIPTTYPLFLNGSWYKDTNGNSCCNDPSTEGVGYKKQLVWISNEITIKNNTSINTQIQTIIENFIPWSRYQLIGCSSNGTCSGYIDISLKIELINLSVVSGNVILSQNNYQIYTYNFRTTSDGSASWTTGGKPTPAC